ncbi:MAG: ABC-F family ATP-binding cassette domain-containing protein [Candidatus Omnitrophica bacterium]|nr:ABC-F family ATP-binding cassette domain-containing protein [Candidatus Omnitrophota bacterium]
MITLNNLSKSYGTKILFKDVSLSINRGEKIGLIGPNGAGKSTLFSLILGESEPNSGHIHTYKNIRIGYLPQESHFASGKSVLAELLEGDKTIMDLKQEKERLEAKNETATKRYGDIIHQLEILGYMSLEHTAKKILAGLGFKQTDFARPVQDLSGGWQMRVLLSKLLTYEYDILLLDEPTNHLDLNAAIWFKDYLASFKGTFIIISHDRDFLDEVTAHTLVLENGELVKIHGNYEQYLTIRGERTTHLTKQFKEQEKKINQLQEFIDRFHAQPNKASQVRAKRKMLEQMEPILIPPDIRESIRTFRFPLTESSGQRIITLSKISKSYGNINVYKDFDFEITKGEKAVLAGENGAGKSTLLKILAGVVNIDAGERILGHNVKTGYFSQTRMDVLSADNTVLGEAHSAAQKYMSEETVRTILGAFLFSGNDSDKKVSVLSGGEKSRLILAKLLINPPNFLLLDEPTTHLDVDAVDALIKALGEYEGTLVFISHDIHFVRSLANVVFEVKSGRVIKYPGNFDYYLEKKAKGEIAGSKPHVSKGKWHATYQALEKQSKQKADASYEEKQKSYNAFLSAQIKQLRKEKEELQAERYVKERIIVNKYSHHSNETKKQYAQRIHDIDARICEIDNQIKSLKTKFLN